MEVGREGGHYLGVVIITLFYLVGEFSPRQYVNDGPQTKLTVADVT